MKKSIIFSLLPLVFLPMIVCYALGNKSMSLDAFTTKICDSGKFIYLIDKDVDLKGLTIPLPPETILQFEGGSITNGILVGDSTEIKGNNKYLFDNILIKGSWKIDTITTDFFKKIDSNTLSNISALSSDKQFNLIQINQDCICPIKEWDSYFNINSHTKVIFNADIYTLPTDKKGGYAINIIGQDIEIIGNNHFLFGTIGSKEQVKCQEYLHGLNIRSTAKDVYVEDINSWLFCGDGFYNSGDDIVLSGLNAKFNGRQGLSITNGTNIEVRNSSFTHTGFLRITDSKGPGAGIDIEPNKGSKVGYVKIINCRVVDNYHYYKGHVNDIQVYGSKNGNILISQTTMTGLSLGTCSNVKTNNCPGPISIYRINHDVSNCLIDTCLITNN